MTQSKTQASKATPTANIPLEETAWALSGVSVNTFTKTKRLVEIIEHYRWSQLVRRAFGLVKSRIADNKTITPTPIVGPVSLKSLPQYVALADIVLRKRKRNFTYAAGSLESGNIVLLNHAVSVVSNDEINTKVIASQTHLWRFQFHYHEYLLTAAAYGETEQTEHFLRLWFEKFDAHHVLNRDDAWHPYCISRRVVAWIFLLVQPGCIQDGELRLLMLNSIAQQCDHLVCNAEYGLGGNHLLENVTVLAIAGSAIDCDKSSSWIELASRIFKSELPLQVLNSGEHYERTPVYHCHVLSNLLRVMICAAENSQMNEYTKPFAQAMLKFLESIVHPDGEVPLFGDSVFLESPSVSEVRQVAVLSNAGFVTDQGLDGQPDDYTVFRSKSLFVVFDHGSIAADHLPAHAHCDALTLEASIEGQRWIVDSGNYDYENSSMRHYCRSSLAHNVVTVDNANQANIWSKFRMGRRPKVAGLQRGAQGSWEWASCSHNAYRGFSVPKMVRLLVRYDDALFCCDHWQVETKIDVSMVGYIHFHPDVQTAVESQSDESFSFKLMSNGVSRILTVFADSVSIEKGWYCPEFGKRLESSVIRYTGRAARRSMTWVLHDSLKIGATTSHDNQISLLCGDCALTLPLSAPG